MISPNPTNEAPYQEPTPKTEQTTLGIFQEIPAQPTVGFTPEEEEAESSLYTAEDRLLAYVDAYGRLPPESLESERLLEEFQHQVSLLSPESKHALHQGFTVKQARLFLHLEGNDAKRAALRMARFWEMRVRQLGDEAFSMKYMPRRTEEDFRRMYEMSLKAAVDPEVDEETKRWARNFSSEWNRANVIRLDEELQAMSLVKKLAYIEAQRIIPEIASSDDHKLLFLRSTDFDATTAAQKIVTYWDTKFQLFGREECFVPYTAERLMKEHPMEASLGFVQRAPGRDASGRAIICVSMRRILEAEDDEDNYSLEGMLKVAWYLLHTVLEDEVCRKHGFIQLNILKGIHRHSGWKLSSNMFTLLNCQPLKFGALHGCGPPSRVHRIAMPLVKWFVGRRMRMRYFSHTGTDEEVVSGLREFGISEDQILTDLGGTMDIVALNNFWLAERISAGI